MSGEKERQGDFVFTAQTVGEYRVCFNNEMSTFADKMVDFEVAVRGNSLLNTSQGDVPNIKAQTQVEDEGRSALLPQKAGSSPEQHSTLEDLIFKVSGQLSTVSRMQKYFRTRENRNFSTVKSTEHRILRTPYVLVYTLCTCFLPWLTSRSPICVETPFDGAGPSDGHIEHCSARTHPVYTPLGFPVFTHRYSVSPVPDQRRHASVGIPSVTRPSHE